MAYQPKSYKKFVATAATATLVASAIAPAASAAFTDVADRYKDAVDYLAAEGISEGYPGGKFGTDDKIKRQDAAVMIAKALGATKDGNYPDAGFTDVPADRQWAVNFLAEKKIVSGKGAGKFGANEFTQRDEMAKIIAGAYNLTADSTNAFPFTDVSETFKQYVDALNEAGIAQGYEGTTQFGSGDLVTRGQFALFVYRAEGSPVAGAELVSATASTAKSFELKFASPVDETKANFEVKKAGVSVNVSKVTFSADKKVATVELSSKLSKGEYTVNVTGVSEKTLTKTVQVEDEKIASINILSDIAVVNNTATPTSATFGYQVKNQYGEDISKTTSLSTNDNAKIQASNGTGTIDVTGKKVGDLVPVTLINLDSAVTTTKVLTLSAAASVSEVAISGVYNKDAKTLNEDTNFANDKFYLLVDVKDQYGNAITNTTAAASGLIKTQSNSTVVGTAGAGNNVTFTSLTVNGETKLGIELTSPLKAGENQVTLISNTNGKTASYKVVVAETTRTDAVTLSQPALAVANEDLLLPVSVLDKEGKAVTDVKVLNSASKGVSISFNGTTVTSPFITKDNTLFVKIPKSAVPAEGIFSVVAQSSTYKVATLTVSVKKAATPTVIRGLAAAFSPTMLANATKTIDVSNLVIEDQYGRVMDSAAVKATLTGGKKIVVKKADSTDTNVNVIDGDITSADTAEVKASTTNGTEKILFVLHDGTKEVASSTAEATFRVTDGTEYKSYEVKAVGTVYDETATAGKTDAAAYDKAIVVYGVLADGSKVKLTNTADYNVVSSNTTVNTDVADGVIDASTALTTYGDGSTVVAPITVTINATGEQFTQDVTFSKSAPKVESVSLVEDKDVDADAVTTLSYDIDALPANFTVAEFVTGAVDNYNLVVTDQYGAAVLATTTSGTVAFADSTTVVAPTLTIVPVKGSIEIVANGTQGAYVKDSSLSAEEEFNVTLTYAGGKSVTVKVVAK